MRPRPQLEAHSLRPPAEMEDKMETEADSKAVVILISYAVSLINYYYKLTINGKLFVKI